MNWFLYNDYLLVKVVACMILFVDTVRLLFCLFMLKRMNLIMSMLMLISLKYSLNSFIA